MMAGAMDLEDQWKLVTVVKQFGNENLHVLLGCPDAESSQIQGDTVSSGDPSLSGPLTDSQFYLQVHHVSEPEVRGFFSKEAFARHIEPFLSLVDAEAIRQRMHELRVQMVQSKPRPMHG